MQSACVVSHSGCRQVLSTDMFLIVKLPLLGSSQSRAHITHMHTHTKTSHILVCDIEAEEVEGGEKEENRESIYLFWKRNSGKNVLSFGS